MLIELFSLGVTAEALWANIGSKSAISLQLGPVDPKFQVERVAPTNHSSQKTGFNTLSYGIEIWTDFSSIFTMHTFDRRANSFLLTRPPCIQCNVVKRWTFFWAPCVIEIVVYRCRMAVQCRCGHWLTLFVAWCVEALDGLSPLWEDSLPSGSGRDGLLRTSVLGHFKRQCKSHLHVITDVMWWLRRVSHEVGRQGHVQSTGALILAVFRRQQTHTHMTSSHVCKEY